MSTNEGGSESENAELLSSQQRLSMFSRERLAPTWFISLYIASAIGCAYVMLPFVHDVVLAGVLIALFRPAYNRLYGHFPRPWLCSTAIVVLIIGLVAAPLVFLIVTLVGEATNAYEATRAQLALSEIGTSALADRIQEVAARYGFVISPEQVANYVAQSADYIRDLVLEQVSSLINNTLSALLHFTVILVLVFYLMVDGPKLKAFIFELSPLPNEEEELIAGTFGSVSRGILMGNGIASVAQGALAGTAMALAGLPSPVLWATVMSIFAFLPLVGVSIVVVPASAYLILTGDYVTGILFFTFCTAQGLFIENVVKTRLISAGTRMHDLVVFMSVLGGIAAFGILGLLYGPLIATIFLTLTDLYLTHYRRALALRYPPPPTFPPPTGLLTPKPEITPPGSESL